MRSIQHVLVATDFSEASGAGLELGRCQARAFDAKLTLLHVYSPALDVFDRGGADPARMNIGSEVHDALARLKSDTEGAVQNLHAEVIAAEHVVEAICEYAREHEVDLIILSAHGRSRLGRLMIGSTAERVARHAECSVLVAR